MRRSAAPSQQGPASKKGHFVPPFLSNKQPVRTGSPQIEERCTNNKKSEKLDTPSADVTRSTRDILHLIQSSASTDSELFGDLEPRLTPPQTSSGDFTQRPAGHQNAVGGSSGSSSNGGLRQFQTRPQLFEAIGMPNSVSSGTSPTAENAQPAASLPRETNAVSSDAETPSRYFSVMWCKVSKKKHKKWEGDAILATKGRSVVLMDMEGKEIGRGCGYKLAELQTLTDGQMLVIGGKEIEVMGVLSEEQFKSGKCFQTSAPTVPDDQSPLPGVSSSRPGPYPPSLFSTV